MTTELQDKELLDIYNNQNRDYAFNLIVRKYQKRLYWHIRKILISHDDTDDALQNTFIKALKGLDKFRQESNLYTWLYRIATNEALTILNSNKRRNAHSIDDTDNYLHNLLESDSYFNGDEAQRKLQKAVLTLPEKQRIVFNMKYFDGVKYEEMADILETSVGALKASFHHSVKKIENYLEKD
ncbi:MAG: RNA polymerase sigma factor [Bacteroidota bacterium]